MDIRDFIGSLLPFVLDMRALLYVAVVAKVLARCTGTDYVEFGFVLGLRLRRKVCG